MSIILGLGRCLVVLALVIIVLTGFFILDAFWAPPGQATQESSSSTDPLSTPSLQPESILPAPSSTAPTPHVSAIDEWPTFHYPDPSQPTPRTAPIAQLAFSLQHPPQWTVHSQTDVDPRTPLLVAFFPPPLGTLDVARNSTSEAAITVRATSRPYATELEIAGNNVGGSITQIVLDGVTGVKFHGSLNPLGTPTIVVVLPRGSGTLILTGMLSPDREGHEQTVERMLSTFRFR
jgi:hypothetical protein